MILHAESKAEVSERKLLRLFSGASKEKRLVQSNVLQLVVMDG